jgi:hypothetical protein
VSEPTPASKTDGRTGLKLEQKARKERKAAHNSGRVNYTIHKRSGMAQQVLRNTAGFGKLVSRLCGGGTCHGGVPVPNSHGLVSGVGRARPGGA